MKSLRKRDRRLLAKPRELRVGWGLDESGDGPDITVSWGEGCYVGDANMLLGALYQAPLYPHSSDPQDRDRTLIRELESRGYDLSTLKITIRKKEV